MYELPQTRLLFKVSATGINFDIPILASGTEPLIIQIVMAILELSESDKQKLKNTLGLQDVKVETDV